MNSEKYTRSVKPVCLIASIFLPMLGEYGLYMGVLIPFFYAWIPAIYLWGTAYPSQSVAYVNKKYPLLNANIFSLMSYESEDVHFKEIQAKILNRYNHGKMTFFLMSLCWLISGVSLVITGVVSHFS